jgi:hypothetical protein
MKMEYANPTDPNNKVSGLRLGPGAMLHVNDLRDSRGQWESANWGAGSIIRPSTPVAWIRPGAELSEEAYALLALMVQDGQKPLFLARNPIWKLVPSAEAMEDERQCRVPEHPDAATELVNYGLICRDEFNDQLYAPTEVGIELVRQNRAH